MSKPDFKQPPRVVADTFMWEQLRRVKLDGVGCRICGASSFRTQLHHLVPRGRLGLGGGDDVPDNLVPLCGHGTAGCHGLVEAWDIGTRSRLRETLSAEEVAYIVGKKSADWLEHAYPSEVILCGRSGKVERFVAGLCESCGEPAHQQVPQ